MVDASLPLLIQQMLQSAFYPHPTVEPIQLIQTHISYVLLTGEYAYKIKKPLDFGFLNYSTLEKRRHFCQEELRLNQRGAAMLYL
ncbi:MAG: adenylyl-sulfate kinase, partial [Pseudanabaenales cyanobacterium]|nr:adenylyl-sulfate kinase [Pseudanabaenales cyanobacterium]